MSDLRSELQAIYDKHGQLTPEQVLEEATPKNHPLHSRFEWDNRVAGPAFRRLQAQDLIRSVKVVYKGGSKSAAPGTIRAYHSVSTPEGHVYRAVEDIKEDPFLKEMVLRDAERRWNELYRRYGHLAEFLEAVQETLAS